MTKKFDLNAPAFGAGAEMVKAADAEETPEVKVVEPEKEPEIVPVVTPEEESKVPYSRFKKFHDRALEAEEEAAKWREEAESLRERPAERLAVSDDLPPQWVKLYGDSDASKDAWAIQKQFNDDIRAQAKQDAIEALRNERQEEVSKVENNVAQIDESFEDLSAFVGRDLTDAEQSALLDIVDDYTPKDRNGNYAGELLPFDKAWEIYELKNAVNKAPKVQSRNTVANLLGNQTQGESVAKDEQNKNFNPLDWNAYKSRI